MIFRLALAIVFFVIAMARPAVAADDGVWLAIRVLDAGVGSGTHEYYGHVEKPIFQALTEAAAPVGFFKMTEVSFSEENKIQPLTTSTYGGYPYGYSGTMYVRAETLVRIIPLDEDFVKTKILPALAGRPFSEKSAPTAKSSK